MHGENQNGVRERPYNLILNHSPVMIAYLDEEERFLFANDKYCKMHGKSEPEIVGRTVNEILGDNLGSEVRRRIDKVVEGQEQRFEAKIFVEPGVEQWVEAYYVPEFDREGNVLGFFAFILDIHDRKTSEEAHAHLKYAVDHGVEGFGLHDDEGNFLYLNQSLLAMYGYEQEEVMGRSWKLLYGEDQVAEIEAVHIPAFMRDGKWRGELVGRRKSGENFDVAVSLTLLTDDEGNPSGMVCHCQDITQRKLSEQTLRQFQKMDALGQLTGGIAHDFNNLLAVIIGNLDLLGDGLADRPEEAALAQSALNAAERGESLTRRLLAFSHKQPLQPETLDLNQVIEGMEDLLKRSLGEQIDVAINLEDALEPIELDQSALENAILNLALNARDAMPNGGTLKIVTKNEVQQAEIGSGINSRGQVRLSIIDSGEGMSADVLERIFDPFFTTKDVGKGSGLGLSMVHGFVNQSNGHVKAFSKPGQGTRIEIYLPCSLNMLSVPMDENDRMPLHSKNSEKILIVEDDTELRELTACILRSLGYIATEAKDGIDSQKIMEHEQEFDLLLADVVLPGGMDGLSIARFAQDIMPGIKVLFMSGYAATATDLDANIDILPKPFTKAILAERLQKILSA